MADSPETRASAAAARPGHVARHSIALLAVQVLVLLSAVANNFLIARMGGPEGKGALYTLQLLSGVVGLSFLHFCLGSAAIILLKQGESTRQEIASGIFGPSVLLGVLPAVIAALTWHWTSTLVGGRFSVLDFWLAVLTIPAMVVTYNVSYFCLGDDRLRQYNQLTAAPSVVLLLSLLGLLAIHKTSLNYLIAAWCLAIFVPSVFAAALILRAAQGTLLPGYALFKKMYHFGWRCHICGVLQQLQHRSPVLLVAVLLPVAQLGVYSLAISLVELLWYIPNTLSIALMPHIAAASKEDASRLTPVICRVTLAVTALLGILLALTCSVLVPWLLPKFAASLIPLWVLMPGLAVASVSRVMASDLNGRGEPMKVFVPVLAGLVIETALGFYCVPKYGLTGAAAVTVVGYVINTVLQVRVYCRLTGVSVRSVLLIHRADIAGIYRAVQARIDKLRELVTPDYAT